MPQFAGSDAARLHMVRGVPLNLIYGPPNSGRAGLIRRGFAASLDRDPILVVPTLDDVYAFERELCEDGAVLGGAAMTFGALFRTVATAGGAPPTAELSPAQRLRAISLDPAIEQEIGDSIAQTADGEQLAMEPARAQDLVAALRGQLDAALAQGGRPVLLCSARARRHLRHLCEQSLPQLTVCSYNEIVPGVRVENMGVVQV